MDSFRIWVTGDSDEVRAGVEEALAAAGCPDVIDDLALPDPDRPPPALLIVCGQDVELTCAAARARPDLVDVPVLAIVPTLPIDRAAAALAAGADEVIRQPPDRAVIGNRVRHLVRAAASARRARAAERIEDVLLRVQDILAAAGDEPEGLRDALLLAAELLEFDRASLIAHNDGSENAYVVAATDDPTLAKYTLRVDAYPELQEVFSSRAPLLISDAQDNPLMRDVRPALQQKGVHAFALFPVVWHKRLLGCAMFRRERRGIAHLDRQLLGFARLFAGDLAAQLADGALLDSLREQTHRISRERYEQERRLRAIDTLRETFEAASDGVIALDGAGVILYVNRSAETITGFAAEGLLGSPMVEIVADELRDELRDATRRVLRGANVDAFDLELFTARGARRAVSVATSTVLSTHGVAVMLLRDVTAERELESELRKTKDFLERLIDSTVDAIVAADTKGQIILFNPGAERVYGYAADEVIGRLPVWKLYPDGVAKQLMRMLRSSSYGGVGRLEQTRRELLTKTGELVPVNMTASIIYENGREVASVGIFSDLRERIRIEQRLLQAQEKLMISEKQALVAELAGAAAHELNQPLTSILGYVELIERTLEPHDRHARAIATIRGEAERMAELVRKIGRITRYETKEYVGSASILDLDKSSGTPEDPR